jgi:O-antigen ligase
MSVAAASPVAWGAGAAAAILQLAAALKTAPPLAGLPFDISLVAFALLLPLLGLLAATRSWSVDPRIAMPLAATGLLAFWLVLAGGWTASRGVAVAKLPEIVAIGPAMVAAGLMVGADRAARAALATTSMLIGVAVAVMVGWAGGEGFAMRVALDPNAAKLQYQVAGLAIAMAASLAALRATEVRSVLAATAWLALVAALAAAALLPGGRTALVALGLGVIVAPALGLWRRRRLGSALGWLAAGGIVAAGAALLLLLRPEDADGLRTLERLTADAGGLDARLGLWSAALRWGGEAAPFGLGTGGFTIAAGHGERRGLYPHNHGLEALAEAGVPGLVLWLASFGGALVAAARLMPGSEPGRAPRIAAMVLPVVLTVMVSTDLGNRMAWFALGLALSLGVQAAPARRGAAIHV